MSAKKKKTKQGIEENTNENIGAIPANTEKENRANTEKENTTQGAKENTSGSTGLIRRIWRENTKKYLSTLIGAMAITSIAAALEAYSVSLLKPIFDQGFVAADYNVLIFLCIQIVVVYFVKGWLAFAYTLILNHVTRRTIQAIQLRVFSHMITLDIKFFTKNSSGQMLSIVVNNCNAISQIAINFITNVFKDCITCLAMFSLIIYFSWKLFLVILIFVPLGALAMRRIENRVKNIEKEATKMDANMFSKISESLQSIKVIKSYNIEKKESEFVGEIFKNMFNVMKMRVQNIALVTPIVDMLSGVILALIIVVGGYEISQNSLTTGDFVAFLGAWVAMYRPLKSILNFRAQLKLAIVRAERVYEIIDTKPDILDREDAQKLGSIKGEIKFKDLCFEYEKDKIALNNINLVIKEGSTVALVGKSGGGKSTLMSLVPRFYDPTSGAVLIDSKDIRDFTQESLREKVAFVSQEVILFDDTIANNIAIAGNADREAVIAAAKNAHAHDFIMAMEKGYDSVVGERGALLSGGQRQRISIARAILKNAPILLLDEATSALDSESEREVQMALVKLMKNRTTIVIAHRLSTIINADLICVLSNGEIVERGTHKELLKLGGEYAKLYSIQGLPD